MNQKLRNILTRQSEARERMIALPEDANDDQVSAAKTELAGIEKELREALAEPEPEPEPGEPGAAGNAAPELSTEEREIREIRGKAELHKFVAAAIAGTAPAGAEAEYAAARNCPGAVPIDMFADVSVETRAVTPAPANEDIPSMHAAIVPPIFQRSVAAYLGIDMPTVPTGLASYPILSTSVEAGMKAPSAAADEGAGAFTVHDADPRRLTGAFRIRREDLARLPGMEASLRDNIQSVMSDALDVQVFSGDNAAPNLNGLFNQVAAGAAPAAGVETFGRFVQAAAGRVDGLHAYGAADVRQMVGSATYAVMAGAFANSGKGDVSAADYLMERTGGVRVSNRIPAAAGNIQDAIFRRANPAGDRVAVAPVWSAVELIRDIYSGAGKGEIVVTAVSLVGGVVILRPGCFERIKYRLSV